MSASFWSACFFVASDIQSSFCTRWPNDALMSSITVLARARADGGNVFATYACPSASPIVVSATRRHRFQRGSSSFAPVKRDENAKSSLTNGVLSHGAADAIAWYL